jgi:acetyl esterase/lipase
MTNREPNHGVVPPYDVAYVERDGKSLLGRLYRPEGKGPFPAVVDVHGGMWTINDRLHDAVADMELARRGTVVLSIDFRMPPDAAYPASLCDIHAAIVWLKAHADEFHIDSKRIGTLGFSSGGHQALLLALRPDHPDYASGSEIGGFDGSVAFTVACWPIVDPVQRYGMAREKGRTDLVDAHDAYWGSVAAMADGNPQYILDRNEQTRTPPALVLQGTADDNIDHRTMEPFAAAYRERGGTITVHKFDGAAHGFIRDDLTAPDAARGIDLIDAFIRTSG